MRRIGWSSPFRDVEAAGKQLRALYEQHERELRDHQPHPALFQEVAGLKERLGRREEARNWHVLVLLDRPDDPLSRAAFERLRVTPEGSRPFDTDSGGVDNEKLE